MKPLKRLVLGMATAGTLVAGILVQAQQLQTRPRYVLRAGDQLDLQYRLTPDINQSVTVEPDGFVNLNVAGELKVSGLTLDQARDLITSHEAGKLNQPELNLVLKEFTRPAIVIAGEVPRPGRMEIREQMTAFSAVMNAGGFTANAKTGKIVVFRKVNDQIAEVRQLNLSKMNKASDLERDMTLEPGDMIYVPRDNLAKFQHYMSVANVGMYFNPLHPY